MIKIAGSDSLRFYVTVRLMPEETVSFEVKFTPRQIGEYNGQLHLFVVDNPERKVTIDLMGEAFSEIVVLEGLELTDIKCNFNNEKREPVSQKSQKSLKSNNSITSECVLSNYIIIQDYIL